MEVATAVRELRWRCVVDVSEWMLTFIPHAAGLPMVAALHGRAPPGSSTLIGSLVGLVRADREAHVLPRSTGPVSMSLLINNSFLCTPSLGASLHYAARSSPWQTQA